MPAYRNLETFNSVALQYIKKKTFRSPQAWKDKGILESID